MFVSHLGEAFEPEVQEFDGWGEEKVTGGFCEWVSEMKMLPSSLLPLIIH